MCTLWNRIYNLSPTLSLFWLILSPPLKMWAWILLGEKGSDSSDKGSHWLSDLYPDLSVDGRGLERKGGRSLLQTMKIHCTLWACMALFFCIISSNLDVERKEEAISGQDLPLAFPSQKYLQPRKFNFVTLCQEVSRRKIMISEHRLGGVVCSTNVNTEHILNILYNNNNVFA